MLAIRLPEDIDQRLTALAKRTGRTKTFYAREAIMAHLEDLEDYYLAAEAYDEFMQRGESARPLDEVERRLDLAD